MDTQSDSYAISINPVSGLEEIATLVRHGGADIPGLLRIFAANALRYVDTPVGGDNKHPDDKAWDVYASVTRRLGMVDTCVREENSLSLSQLYLLWYVLAHLRGASGHQDVVNLTDGLISTLPLLVATVIGRMGDVDEANLALSEAVFSESTDMLPTQSDR